MDSVAEDLPDVSHVRREQFETVVARNSWSGAVYVVLRAPVDHYAIGVSDLSIIECIRAVVEHPTFAVGADGVHEDFGGSIGQFSLHGNVVAVIGNVALSPAQADAGVFGEGVQHAATHAAAGNHDHAQ